MIEDLRDPPRPAPILARSLADLVEMLREDMADEEADLTSSRR